MAVLGQIYDDLCPLHRPLRAVLDDHQPPHIAVIGEESSGKSSVLRAISGVDCFPQGEEVVTRMKIAVRLRNKRTKQRTVLCVKDTTGKTVHGPEVVDPERGCQQVKAAMDQQVARAKATIVTDRYIQLEISGPSLPCVDLIDLPGIIADPKEAHEATVKVIEDHIQANKATVYLVILPACSRPSTDASLRLVRAHKLEHNALGVFTKCDHVVEARWPTLVARVMNNAEDKDGGHRHLEHGWIATVCRHSQAEKRGVSFEKAEQEYFAQEGLARLPAAGKAGVHHLKDKVQERYSALMLEEWVPETSRLLAVEQQKIAFRNSVLGLPAEDRLSNGEQRLLMIRALKEAFDRAQPELEKVLKKCCFALSAAAAAIPVGDADTLALGEHVKVLEFMRHKERLRARLTAATSAAVDAFRHDVLACVEGAFRFKASPTWDTTKVQERADLIAKPPFVLSRFPRFLALVMMDLKEKVTAWGSTAKDALKRLGKALFEPSSMQTLFTYHHGETSVSMAWNVPAVEGALVAELLKHVTGEEGTTLFSNISAWTRRTTEEMGNQYLEESDECKQERRRLRQEDANVDKAKQAVQRLLQCSRSRQVA
eukprot:TRINITY_DN11793_c0_g1_i1.p1 TRINITY_DN11793_c0_g1~~TRINITY_DN11793_c0_g1_i1.p1  ORF type:complete len:654 (+),score=211.04 TRINITY_DN11793_c0_g1_i1:170-1963(+)